MGPCSSSPGPSPLSAPQLTAQGEIGPASLLGANTKPRSAPKGPFLRVLEPQCWGMGTTKHQHQTHPAARLTPGPIGVPPIIQGKKQAGPSEPPATFEGPPRQNPWSHDHAPQGFLLGFPLRTSQPSSQSCQPGSLCLTQTLGLLPRTLPKEAGTTTLGIGDHQAPVPDSPCHRDTTQAHRGPVAHSGWEKSQSPPSPGNI